MQTYLLKDREAAQLQKFKTRDMSTDCDKQTLSNKSCQTKSSAGNGSSTPTKQAGMLSMSNFSGEDDVVFSLFNKSFN